MYQYNFKDNTEEVIKLSSKILECKSFAKMLYQTPSDRHAYSLQFYGSPIR